MPHNKPLKTSDMIFSYPATTRCRPSFISFPYKHKMNIREIITYINSPMNKLGKKETIINCLEIQYDPDITWKEREPTAVDKVIQNVSDAEQFLATL